MAKKQITSAGRILRELGAQRVSGEVLDMARAKRAGFKASKAAGSPAQQEAAWLAKVGPRAIELARHAGRQTVAKADFDLAQ